MKLRLLFCSILLVPVFAVAAPAAVKWHPGHYVFVAHGAITPEVLALPHFRGVQKNLYLAGV